MADELNLDARWLVWVAENLLENMSTCEIISSLVQEGCPEGLARSAVLEMAESPHFLAAKAASRAARQTVRLRLEHLSILHRVEEWTSWDRERFLYGASQAQLPVVLKGFATDWPLLRWGWEGILRRFGEAQITARMPGELQEMVHPTGKMRFSEFLHQLESPPPQGPAQLVARSGALASELSGMMDGLTPDEEIVRPCRKAIASVWIAAKNTLTPLHYDVSDAALVALLGQKEVVLFPPENLDFSRLAEGYLGPEIDASDLDVLKEWGLSCTGKRTVRLQPGDLLFIPTGWWHQVKSVEKSLSVTFAGLHYANNFEWYKPVLGSISADVEPT